LYDPFNEVLQAKTRGGIEKKPSEMELNNWVFVKKEKDNKHYNKEMLLLDDLFEKKEKRMLASSSGCSNDDKVFAGLIFSDSYKMDGDIYYKQLKDNIKFLASCNLMERNESYYWETKRVYNVESMVVLKKELEEIEKYLKESTIK
jgi:hypothetical protein